MLLNVNKAGSSVSEESPKQLSELLVGLVSFEFIHTCLDGSNALS